MQEVNDKDFSIINNNKIIFYGIQHFVDEIANGDCCFICGVKPNIKVFNNEHIIPDWILRKYDLYRELLTLPNSTKIRYDQYKVPCCQDCNTELGTTYEEPISQLLNNDYKYITSEIHKNPKILQLLYRWLCLIYIKTHLKDRSLLINRDMRSNSGFIGEQYSWEEMHHIHCIVRSHYTGARIEDNVYGTIIILPVSKRKEFGNFDYIDGHLGKVVYLQLGEFAIIGVLNDACGCYSLFMNDLKKIHGPVNTFQLRELAAHLNYININLKHRPIFQSSINKLNGDYKIIAEIPQTACLVDENERISSIGEFLRFYIEPLMGDFDDKVEILKQLEEGKRSYLFNEKGEFQCFKGV